MNELLSRLAEPFEPQHITWKPGHTTKDGGKCMAMAYADLRAYQDRLDAILGLEWSVEYLPWGDSRVIARLTINGVTRASTGEMEAQDEKNGMGGTVAEAQAFKRAAAMFGMGRYLYDLPSEWVEFDAQRKRISEAGQAALDNRYKAWYRQNAPKRTSAASGNVAPDAIFEKAQPDPAAAKLIDHFNAIGKELYNGQWEKVRERNVRRVSLDRTPHFDELKAAELQALIDGMMKVKGERTNGAAVEA
jgi:hypothetical protein